MNKPTLLALALLLTGTAQADIHKCIDPDGRVIYTQSPCGKTLVVRTDQPSELTVLESRARTLTAKIAVADHLAQQRERQDALALERAAQAAQAQRDAELAAIEHRRAEARNNLAGAVYLQSLATREQAVVDNYAATLDRLYAR